MNYWVLIRLIWVDNSEYSGFLISREEEVIDHQRIDTWRAVKRRHADVPPGAGPCRRHFLFTSTSPPLPVHLHFLFTPQTSSNIRLRDEDMDR